MLDVLADALHLVVSVCGGCFGKFRVFDFELGGGCFYSTYFVARMDLGAFGLDGVAETAGEEVPGERGADDGFVEEVAIVNSSHCRGEGQGGGELQGRVKAKKVNFLKIFPWGCDQPGI